MEKGDGVVEKRKAAWEGIEEMLWRREREREGDKVCGGERGSVRRGEIAVERGRGGVGSECCEKDGHLGREKEGMSRRGREGWHKKGGDADEEGRGRWRGQEKEGVKGRGGGVGKNRKLSREGEVAWARGGGLKGRGGVMGSCGVTGRIYIATRVVVYSLYQFVSKVPL